MKVKTLKPEISYVGIDPSATCIYYMRELVRINNFSKVSLINLALGSDEDLQFLYGYSYEDTRATLRENYISAEETIMKNLTAVYKYDTLATHLKLDNKFILKIDVEGEELNVILGAINTISKYHPPIICEILPHKKIQDEIERQKQLLDLLTKLNYKIYMISEDGICKPANPLDNSSKLSESNYLLIYSDSVVEYPNSLLLSDD